MRLTTGGVLLRTGLRTRLIATVLLAIVPMLAISLWQANDEHNETLRETRLQARTLAEAKAQAVRDLLTETRHVLQTVGSSPSVREGSWQRASGLIASVHSNTTDYLNIGITDSRGRIVASALPSTRVVDVSDRDYYRDCVRGRKFVIGGYQTGRITGKPAVNCAVPILDDDGGVLGIVFCALDLDAIEARLDMDRLPREATLTLIDAEGRVLTRSGDAEGFVGEPLADEDLVKAALSSDRSNAEMRGLDGLQRLYAFERVTPGEPHSPHVALGFDKEALFAPERSYYNRVLLILMAVSAVALAGSYGIAEIGIRRPLDDLRSVARRIADGDLDARTNLPARGDEIGELAEEFDLMAAALAADAEAVEAARADLARLNFELEDRVAERTAQLEASNRELEAFSYSVSHDLRAPLRAVDGFSLALLEEKSGRFDDEAHDYLSRIRAASQRMGLLIDSLLSLSRVARHELRREPVDLSRMAEDVIGGLCEAEPQRDASFSVGRDALAFGDATLLRDALENLLGNAWKYTSEREHAEIGFGYSAEKRAYFVSDNGVGFDMAYAGKLFSAFQRLHPQERFAGVGVGLATVARIVNRHGGRIWAEAAQGEGATFYFTLPAYERVIGR